MKKLLTLLAVCSVPALASAQFLDARNRAMGGTGVASSHYAAAGFINPALLAHSKEGDSFALILPSISIGVSDKDGLIEAIDNFQDVVNQAGTVLDDPGATPGQKLGALISVNQRLQALNNKQATLDLGFGFAFAMPSQQGTSWAIVASTQADGQVGARIDPADTGLIFSATSSTDLDSIMSEGVVLGAGVTEVGLAVATSIQLAGLNLAIGATPKAQRVDTYNYSINVNNFDEDNYDDSRYRSDKTGFNLDLGAALSVSESIVIGLSARNVIEQEVDTVVTNGSQFVSGHIEPTLTLGAAFKTSGFTLTADVDILERERFKTKPGPTFTALLDDESRMFRVGAEYDAFNWLQIRAGGLTDLEDTISDAFTAGIGISPFDVVHIDVTGAIGEGDTYAAAIQAWFTF